MTEFACWPQTFIKAVNYQHIMPTRYTLDLDLKNAVPTDVLDNPDRKDDARRVSHPSFCYKFCIPPRDI